MQDESELDYAKLKDFLSFYIERYLPAVEDLPPNKRPMAICEALEKKSMKLASKGLRQAVNDCVERSLHFAPAEVDKFDS